MWKGNGEKELCISYLSFFLIYFIFKLYKIVLVLPNIEMNPPQVYMYSPSWTLLPPPSPYHPSGLSGCTSPKHLSNSSKHERLTSSGDGEYSEISRKCWHKHESVKLVLLDLVTEFKLWNQILVEITYLKAFISLWNFLLMFEIYLK